MKTYMESLSIVSASMNRHNNILRVIDTWLNIPFLKEIIIIDWCSDVELSTLLNNKPLIKIVKVRGHDKWVLSWAFNLGLSLASGDYILKLDADVWVEEDFLKRNKLNKDTLYRGKWNESETPNLNGQFLVNKLHLERVGYFNELITSYGYDDCDLYRRLNLTEHLIQGLHHIENGQDSMAFQDRTDKDVEICYNRFLAHTHKPIAFNPSRYHKVNETSYIIIDKEVIYDQKCYNRAMSFVHRH